MRLPGKQVAPATTMGNLPAIAAPQGLEQYLERINEGLATAEYLVGPTAPFTTIQAAINAALADGASPANPKVVLVMPAGPYIENLTLTGGGITLVALAPNPETGSVYLIGDVSVVDPGLGGPFDFPSYWFQGFYIEGQITISGSPSANRCKLVLNGCTLGPTSGDGITNTVNGFDVILQNGCTSFNAASTDWTVTSGVGANLSCRVLESNVARLNVANGTITGRSSTLGAVVCGASSSCDLDNCFVFATSETPVQLNATGGQLSDLFHCTLQRSGTAGPAVSALPTAPYRNGNNSAVGNLTDPAFPTPSLGSQDWEGYAGTTRNRNMAASVTAVDGAVACATALSVRPAQGSMVRVTVNGVEVLVAATPAEKATSECYFSGDGGATARSFGPLGTIAAGDLLYWNGSVATYQLDATDRIRFDYPVSPFQIN